MQDYFVFLKTETVDFGIKTIEMTTINAINIDPETLSGTPVFRGTRIPVKSLFDYIGTGESLDEFLENFPTVKKQQALDVLLFVGKLLNQKEIYNEDIA